jgi:geranylgeranyl diphosphate synthase type II
LKAFKLAEGNQRSQLAELFSINTIKAGEKIKKVKAIYEALNIRQETELKIETYYQRAKSYLDKIDIANEKKIELLRFADNLKNRDR